MNLDDKQKQELRENLELKCKRKSLISRIHVEKDILEQLLFSFDKDYKYIVWTGTFLKKINLNMISFNDVWWGNIAYKDFEGTNVSLDFSKYYYDFFDNAIRYCNFSFLDLSNSSIDVFDKYEFIAMEEAKLPEGFGCDKSFFHCDFKGTNLSLELSSYELYSRFLGCNLSNTNTIITHRKRKMSAYEKTVMEEYKEYKDIVNVLPHGDEEAYFYYGKIEKIEKEYKDLIAYMKSSTYLDMAIQNGLLNGCIIKDERNSSYQKKTKILKGK